MGEGARGEWLFHIVYTSEPHDGALFFLFHILLGKVAAVAASLGGWPLTETMVLVYHIARIVFGAMLLLTVYRFTAMFTASRAIRRLAFLIVAFSGGFGWLLLLSGQPNWLGSSPVDLILPEGFTFLVLYALPHIALGRTLLLAGFMVLWTNPNVHRSVIGWIVLAGDGLDRPILRGGGMGGGRRGVAGRDVSASGHRLERDIAPCPGVPHRFARGDL